MRITLPVNQLIRSSSVTNFKNALLKTIAESSTQIKASEQLKILNEKFSNANKWYIKFTKLDQVYLAQERVSALQGKLLDIQEKRRDVSRQLNEVREKSIALQDQIHKVKRQEDLEKFLDLMKAETEVLKLEKSITKIFQEYDQNERELFTAFTDSIRDSHEKQRAQMEYTKYFGLILGILSSFLAFIYSTLRKEQLIKIIDGKLMALNLLENRKDLDQLIQKNMQINDQLVKEVSKNTKILNLLKANVNNIKRPNVGNVKNIPVETQDTESTKYVKYLGIAFGVWFISQLLLSS